MFVTFFDTEDNRLTIGPFDSVQVTYNEVRGVKPDGMGQTLGQMATDYPNKGMWVDEQEGGIWPDFLVHEGMFR